MSTSLHTVLGGTRLEQYKRWMKTSSPQAFEEKIDIKVCWKLLITGLLIVLMYIILLFFIILYIYISFSRFPLLRNSIYSVCVCVYVCVCLFAPYGYFGQPVLFYTLACNVLRSFQKRINNSYTKYKRN